MADRSEELFQSIETIAKGLVSDLKFNKTVICTIKDNKEAKNGKYYVTDGTSNFYAYCENTDYLIGQSVYVLIPNGDYSNQKIITGKYLSDNNDIYVYKSPWESFINITDNLFNDATDILASDKYSLIANGDTKEVLLWSNENLNLKGYTTIGVKAKFKTLLDSFNTTSGHYGIRIKIRFINDSTSQKQASSIIRQIEFNNDEMYGNTYNFETFYSQEKLFVISEPDKIIDKIWVYFFQDADFLSAIGAAIPVAAVDNIFIKDTYLAFGYDLNTFDKDSVLLYSLNSSTYDASSTDEQNKKNLKLRWIHKTDENLYEYYSEEDEKYSSQMVIHWYQYNLSTGIQDELAGNFWQEIEEAKNKFSYTFYPNTTLGEEKYKVIIESPPTETLLANNNNLELEEANFRLQEALAEYNDDLANANNIDPKTLQNSLDKYNEALENYEFIKSQYSVETQYYESNILTFTNESLVANYTSIDLINGLKIECDLDGYQGIYNIYNSANELQSSSESQKLRLLTAVFNSIVTGQESLDDAEKITWQFPLTKTMIQPPEDGKEYNTYEGDEYYVSNDGNYCLITRDASKNMGTIGSSFLNATNQYFRIKSYLVESATNNTINCYVTKNNITYSASISLSFGTSGNSGTDYTFILSWESGKNCIYSYNAIQDRCLEPTRIDAHLYDENNNELVLNNVKFSWVIPVASNDSDASFLNQSPICFCNVNGETITELNSNNQIVNAVTYTGNGGYCYLHYDNSKNDKDNQGYHILKAEVTTDDAQEVKSNGEPLGYKVILTAYLPIAVCHLDTITRMEGCTKVIYSSLGTNPQYYTGAYKLFEGTEEFICSNWEVSINDKKQNDSPSERDFIINNYYPSVACDYKYILQDSPSGNPSEKNYYELKNNKYYKSTHTEVQNGIQYYIRSNNIGYYYPIIPSMFFSTDGICCVKAIKDNNDIWLQPIIIDQDHYQSSLLNSWNGKLSINEETGTIMSTMFAAGRKDSRNRFSGVLAGYIGENSENGNEDEGIFGYHEGDQSFGFRTNGKAFIGKSNKGRIEFDGNSGQIKSMSYKTGSDATGMLIDLDDGFIDIQGATKNNVANTSSTTPSYTNTSSQVRISALTPYMMVKEAGKTIFQIDTTTSFIQTNDYDSANKNGARITLKGASDDPTGNKKNPSFELRAFSSQGGIKISSISPFIKVDAQNSSNQSVTIFQIGNDQSFLQTVDYQSGEKTGAKIVLGDSTKKASFEIKGYSDDGGVKISSTSPYLVAQTKLNNEYKNLLYIGTNNYYLQSADYNTTNETGTNINLTQGKITSYSFDLKAINSDIGTIYINSTNSTYPFRIEGNVDTNAHSGSYSSTATTNVGKSFFRIKWTGDFKAGNNTNYLEYSSGRFTLKGGMISGGAINIGNGYFQANDEEVIIGEFESKNTNRGILQSSDECSGMSNFAGKGGLLLWAGWHSESNYQFLVNDNSTRVGGTLYANAIGNSTYYSNTALGTALDSLYTSIRDYNQWLNREQYEKITLPHSEVCQSADKHNLD